MKELWNRLDLFFHDCFHLLRLLSQTSSFGFFNTYSNNLIYENHILLLFKIYLYNSRRQEKLESLQRLKALRKKVLETMIKRLCCTTKTGKILKICYLFLKKHYVSLNNDPNGWGWWGFVFCILAYFYYFHLIFFLIFFCSIYFAFIIIVLLFLWFNL